MGKIVYTPGVIVDILPDQKKFWKKWQKKVRTANKRLAQETSIQEEPVEVDFSIFTPDKYLLSEATIVAGVEREPGRYRVVEPHNKFANDNHNIFYNDVLLQSYKSFIWAENYLEHVQEPALSKGKILDAVAWVAREFDSEYDCLIPTVFIDILVATSLTHEKLVSSIKSGATSKLSMGCEITRSICTKCERTFVEGEEEPCKHIKNDLGKYFYGNDGRKHVIAEACGSPEVPGSLTFIEASWVKIPAFEPAVRHDTLRVGDAWSGKILKAKVPQSRIQEAAREK